MIAHHQGRYQCQRGCKEKFKTWANLDEHHKSKHSQQQHQFQCIKCNSTFLSKDRLDEHFKKKHAQTQWKCDICNNAFISQESLSNHIKTKHTARVEIACEFCGQIIDNNQEMVNHRKECHTQFQEVRTKICKYFINGGCIKGNRCLFTHPKEKQVKSVPACRNGQQCRYLASGVCKFFHSRKRFQEPRNQGAQDKASYKYGSSQGRQSIWCRFLEDCNRVPNCKYVHYYEDFPKLQKTNNVPISMKTRMC